MDLSLQKKDRVKSFGGWLAAVAAIWILSFFIQDLVDPYVFLY